MIRTAEFISAMFDLASEPMPLLPLQITPDFPLEILPPYLRRVVIEVFQLSMAPASSIVGGLLCALSASQQGLISVQKRAHQLSPVSLAVLVSLDSGERKSSSLAPLFAGIHAFERENVKIDLARLSTYHAQLKAWESINSGLISAIRMKTKNQEDAHQLSEELVLHESMRPKLRPKFRAIFEKASVSALISHMAEGIQSTALITDEAMALLSGSSARDFGILNKLIDGAPFRSDTFRHAIEIDSPSLTFGLWGQSMVINDFVNAQDQMARTTGFLARCYLIRPKPTSGARTISPHEDVIPTKALDIFNQFCFQSLEQTSELLANKDNAKTILRFSQKANELWCEYYNYIERQINENADVQACRDLASKQGDKVARIAALFHSIDGEGELISADTMWHAIQVGDWLFRQSIYFLKSSQVEQMPKLAIELFNWLADQQRTTGRTQVSRTEIMQFGPSSLRRRANLLPALDLLVSWGKIWTFRSPGGGRTIYIGIQPIMQPVMQQPSLTHRIM